MLDIKVERKEDNGIIYSRPYRTPEGLDGEEKLEVYISKEMIASLLQRPQLLSKLIETMAPNMAAAIIKLLIPALLGLPG
jgi:hypothetical protein